MGLLLLGLAFVTSYFGARKSLPTGIGVVMSWGYSYGIVRANFPDAFSHFIFDAAAIGLYLARLLSPPRYAGAPSLETNRRWFYLLMIWPVIMFCIPLQPLLIQTVGLRGNGFLLPFLFLGMWLQADDASEVASWLAVLNLIAIAVAMAEFLWGVKAFFPENAITKIIYNSHDVAGFTAMRIPSSFSSAHAYGGTMVYTVPWLLGAWMQPKATTGQRILFASAMIAALFGVFLCAARSPVIGIAVLVVVASASGQIRGGFGFVWILILLGVGYLVSSEERLRRFATLGDREAVTSRIEGSVSLEFFDLLSKYPLGNGMGAGGTSIPYFLQHLLRDPVGLESEYSRILLEQGIIGLALWVGFLIWFLTRRPTNTRDPWYLGKTLCWWLTVIGFLTGLIGMGLMTSIPQSSLLFLGTGFCLTPPLVRRTRATVPFADSAVSHSLTAKKAVS